MVLVTVAFELAWDIWYLGVHYYEIKRTPVPNLLRFDIELLSVALVFTLIGGFIQKPSARVNEQAGR